jgi:uncharacterized protein YndB with AHSA1/START domain
MSSTLQTVDGNGVLRIERRLSHRPDKVWKAITDPAQLRAWFPSEMSFELERGGVVAFDLRGGEWPSTTGEITDLEPERVFAFTWGDDHLRWEIVPEPTGDACTLVLVHTFGDRPGAASFAAGWQTCIDALDASLAGETFQPPSDNLAARHEDYIREFGLDDGSSETTDDGWTVRFERQLTRPIDEVATALFGSGAAGPVEVTIQQGTGHGARLVVVERGPAARDDLRVEALASWKARIESLAAELAERNRKEAADH